MRVYRGGEPEGRQIRHITGLYAVVGSFDLTTRRYAIVNPDGTPFNEPGIACDVDPAIILGFVDGWELVYVEESDPNPSEA